MKKLLKFIAYAIGAVLALALLLVLTLPLWLGPVVKPTVRTVVPKFTGTSFDLAHLYLNPYTGRLEIGGFVLGNPKGYDEPVAVSLSNLVFDAGMTTLADKYVHIEEITIDGLFASYVDGGEHDVDNFTQIQYNVYGGKEKYEEAKRKAAEKEAEEENKAEEGEEPEKDVSERKLVIDKLTVKNVRVKYGLVTIPVPVDIVLTDIGKDSGGATFSEVCEQVWEAILKSAGAVGGGVKALGSFIGEQAGKLGEHASKLGESATAAAKAVGDGASKAVDTVSSGVKSASDAVGDGASKAVDTVSGGVKSASDAVGSGASKAADTVGDGASKAVDTVGEGAKKATDAVSDGAKKATDAVKNLFSF